MKDYKTCFQIYDHTTGELLFSENKTFSSESSLFLRLDEVLGSFKRCVWKRDNLALNIQLQKDVVPQQKELF